MFGALGVWNRIQAEYRMEPVNHALTCAVLPTLQMHMQECRQYTGSQALDRLVTDVQRMVETLGRTRHDSAKPCASRPPAPLQ